MFVVSWRGLGAGVGNVGGAGAVAVDDGRQPLHVGTEHLGHGLALGLAQLRKLLGDMGHRAMMLADLHAVNRDRPPAWWWRRSRRWSSAPATRSAAASTSASTVLSAGLDTGQDGVDAAPGERANRVLAADFPQLPHGGHRQVVVGVVELGPAGRGQPVTLRGAPAANLLPGGGGRRLGVARLDQRVQMTPHAGGRQAQPVADLSGGDRSGLQQQAHDGAAGVAIRHNGRGRCVNDWRGSQVRSDFHNTSVTQFRRSV